MFVESVAVNDKGKLDHYLKMMRELFDDYSATILEIYSRVKAQLS
jgi:hypothetical protein